MSTGQNTSGQPDKQPYPNSPGRIWRAIPFMLILMVMLITGGVAFAGLPAAVPAGISTQAQQGKEDQQAKAPVFDAHVSQGNAGAGLATITNIDMHDELTVDLGKAGIRP